MARNSAVVATVLAGSVVANDQANALTAGEVVNELSTQESVAYLSGVHEGLVLAYYLRDKPSTAGQECADDWFRDNTSTSEKYLELNLYFQRHAERSLGVLVYALLKQSCGEL